MSKYKFDTTDLPLIEVVGEKGTVVTSIDSVSVLMDTVKDLKDDVAGVTKHYKHNILSQAVKEVGNCSFHDF